MAAQTLQAFTIIVPTLVGRLLTRIGGPVGSNWVSGGVFSHTNFARVDPS